MPAETQTPLSFDPLVDNPGLAQLQCDLKSFINPNFPQTERHNDAWAVKMGLVDDTTKARSKLRGSRIAMLGAGIYPKVTQDQLEIATNYLTWLFAFDDICDTLAVKDPKYEAQVRVLEDQIIQVAFGASTEPTDHPLLRSLENIRNRLSQHGHPSWMVLLGLKHKHYLEAVRWERKVRTGGRPPVRAAFERMRPGSVGVEPCLTVLGAFLTNGTSTELLDCFFIQQLKAFTVNIISYTNDIYSFNKEFQEGVMDNIVMVIREEKNVEWSQAIQFATALVNDEVAAFLDLESNLHNLRAPLDDDTLEYIEGMKTMIASNLAWSSKSDRYLEYNSSWTPSGTKGKSG